MKFIFSLLFFMVFSSHAAEVILISHTKETENVEITHKLLTDKFFIPDNLIKMQKEECSLRKDVVIHLCFDEAGEMRISYVNQKVMKEVLGVFYEN